jgi:FdrA protein
MKQNGNGNGNGKHAPPALGRPLRVVNVGLEVFAEELENAGVHVTRVRWRPPANGDERLVRILEALSR